MTVAGRRRLLAVLVLAAFVAVAAWSRAAGSGTPRLTAARTAGSGVELTFTARPAPDLSHVSVRDGDENTAAAGAPAAGAGNTLVMPLRPGTGGDLTVSYHVVFADGTSVGGESRLGAGGSAPGGSAHQHGTDPVGGVLLLADLAAIVVLAVLFLRRPRRAPLSG